MARGNGREAISINNPPAAISANSPRVISTSARTSCNTQSSPFNFGERAHPGMPITGTSPTLANINKLPGSTANPNWITCPPASITACGNSSCRSIIADPPQSKMMSAPPAKQFRICSATSVLLCAQTGLAITSLPNTASRSAVTFLVAANRRSA